MCCLTAASWWHQQCCLTDNTTATASLKWYAHNCSCAASLKWHTDNTRGATSLKRYWLHLEWRLIKPSLNWYINLCQVWKSERVTLYTPTDQTFKSAKILNRTCQVWMTKAAYMKLHFLSIIIDFSLPAAWFLQFWVFQFKRQLGVRASYQQNSLKNVTSMIWLTNRRDLATVSSLTIKVVKCVSQWHKAQQVSISETLSSAKQDLNKPVLQPSFKFWIQLRFSFHLKVTHLLIK